MIPQASLSGRLPTPVASCMGTPLRLAIGRSTSIACACTSQLVLSDRRRDSGAVQSGQTPSPHPHTSRASIGQATSISALDVLERRLQRPGRRRLHICAAGGPSKKLGSSSSPRGEEVPPPPSPLHPTQSPPRFPSLSPCRTIL